MSLVLYGIDASFPVRACLLTIKALRIDVVFKELDFVNREHLQPEFLKLNPLHTVPAFRDGDFSVWDSHVINAYLVDKYGKDDSLYPRDLQKRAVVNQRMYFDVGVLFPRVLTISYPIVMEDVRSIDKDKAAALEDVPHRGENMAPILYGTDASPPCRASLMTIQALGIEVDIKEVSTFKNDHMEPEFLEINPLHTIPTLQDGDFYIWDSHVINSYLVDKYGKDDSLYPKDLQKRAVVDQRMYFDVGILFTRLRAAVYPVLRQGAKSLEKARVVDINDAYNSLETLLERSIYVAGDQLTIADFSIVTSVTSGNILVPIASNRFPKISEWLVRMQALPYYAAANQVGLDNFASLIKSKLG